MTTTPAAARIIQTSLKAIEDVKPRPKIRERKHPKKTRDEKAKPRADGKADTDKSKDFKPKVTCYNFSLLLSQTLDPELDPGPCSKAKLKTQHSSNYTSDDNSTVGIEERLIRSKIFSLLVIRQ